MQYEKKSGREREERLKKMFRRFMRNSVYTPLLELVIGAGVSLGYLSNFIMDPTFTSENENISLCNARKFRGETFIGLAII